MRSGHSLVELMVAIVVLAVGMGAVASGAVAAARWTGDSVGRQEALLVGRGIVDSLSVERAPGAGSRSVGPFQVEWTVDSLDPGLTNVDVVVSRHGSSPLVRLQTLHAAPLPFLASVDPDTAAAGVEAVP